ncbi:hypothetical protein [Eubacterium aggregans]|uniref:hypothetical protein n=1 Tax=Eubacterium aggregans TaxID=81409 RepID=UPI003F29FE80
MKSLSDAGMTAFVERETKALTDAEGYLACVKKLNTLYTDGTRKQITDEATAKGCDEAKAQADKIGDADIKKQAIDLVDKAKKDVEARNEQVVAAGGTVDESSGAVTAWVPATSESYSGSSGGGSGYSGGSDYYSDGGNYSSGGSDNSWYSNSNSSGGGNGVGTILEFNLTESVITDSGVHLEADDWQPLPEGW